MYIYRAPKFSNGYWNLTDRKLPENYLDNLGNENRILLDITKDKSGERHSMVRIDIEPEDIEALTKKYFQDRQREINELNEKVEKLESGIVEAVAGFNAIFNLCLENNEEKSDQQKLADIIRLCSKYKSSLYYFK